MESYTLSDFVFFFVDKSENAEASTFKSTSQPITEIRTSVQPVPTVKAMTDSIMNDSQGVETISPLTLAERTPKTGKLNFFLPDFILFFVSVVD